LILNQGLLRKCFCDFFDYVNVFVVFFLNNNSEAKIKTIGARI